MAAISNATLSNLNGTTAATTTAAADDPGSQDRFLKLLVTQLQNQDPLSPMDNAQLTSQIAQINTVSGIATLNTSVQQLSSQFLQMQTLQGASLVGKNVIVPGNKLDIADGVAQGGFELTSAADAVKVELLSPAGQVVDTLNLGAQSSGVHGFDWPAGSYDNTSNLTFRVTATSGSTALASTALMRDTVNAVSASGSALQLQLARSGTVDYSTVKAIN
ncbi:MAG TPA: flagellar hook capping FlgD N-terminal domain-containing protein [Burkholderiaceae bacterium]|nr:flagellar hook capping FlgD N-terminal domain-containing protein [Burkholderiaceae bacterium]